MANQEQLKLLKTGVEAWNLWRKDSSKVRPDLRNANLHSAILRKAQLYETNLKGTDLRNADLKRANFTAATLTGTNFSGADLSKATFGNGRLPGADLSHATLLGANFGGANLGAAKLNDSNLSGADLSGANLKRANLRNANLRDVDLSGADLNRTLLVGADLSGASLGGTVFANIDLSAVKGLNTIRHLGPSTIGIDTLIRSSGHIPEMFLRGAGVPEDVIIQIPALIAGIQPIQFHSCFISYSHQDEAFSQRLHSRMQSENLRVWYAPEDMKGGRKLHEEIFHAIQIHDKLLLVLSENSMKSEWVITEVRRARKIEREENRRKLFPIRLVDFDAIQRWECFDADTGKDLAVEFREYYIPDFSNWKDHDGFETEFAKLLRDLKATDS
jgi:uncharacterized protein YjbI with pentapeptide repeats